MKYFVSAVLVALAGLLFVPQNVRVAAQRKELPCFPNCVAAQRKELPCFPNCGVLKQDIAWIQHRIAGADRD